MKYWIESSFDFEDKEKEYEENLVVAVDMGDYGTESIATFPANVQVELELLIKRINELTKEKRNEQTRNN